MTSTELKTWPEPPQALYSLWKNSVTGVGRAMEVHLDSHIAFLRHLTQLLIDRLSFGVPSLVLYVAGAEEGKALPVATELAAVIETIQASILSIHDKVENQQAIASQSMETGAAVLVGDFLTTRAFETLVRVGRMDIMRILSEGISRTIEGAATERSDALHDDARPTSRVTETASCFGVLVGAAAEVGARMHGRDDGSQTRWRQYGEFLGIAGRLLGIRIRLRGDWNIDTMFHDTGRRRFFKVELDRAAELCNAAETIARLETGRETALATELARYFGRCVHHARHVCDVKS